MNTLKFSNRDNEEVLFSCERNSDKSCFVVTDKLFGYWMWELDVPTMRVYDGGFMPELMHERLQNPNKDNIFMYKHRNYRIMSDIETEYILDITYEFGRYLSGDKWITPTDTFGIWSE